MLRFVTLGLPAEEEDEYYYYKTVNDTESIQDPIVWVDEGNYSDTSVAKLTGEFQLGLRLNTEGKEDSCENSSKDNNDFTKYYNDTTATRDGRMKWFLSHCVLKETSNVRHMLQRFPEDKLFDYRDKHGYDILSMVAMEGHIQVMRLLYEAGSQISNLSVVGRSALMEAALWGRDETVKLLLELGADPGLRDEKSLTVLDLAKDNDRNRRERRTRSDLYKETEDLRKARIRICARLESILDSSSNEANDPGILSAFNGHFRQDGSELAWFAQTASYQLDYKSRTVGMLHCGNSIPIVSAMSGSNCNLPHPQTLDNKNWTHKVRKLCEVIGHKLQKHGSDPSFVGPWYACHAEKQLATYYIDKHFFWGSELARNDVQELQKLQPLGTPKRASIVVNRQVCEDCEVFLERVRRWFAVVINVESS